MADDRSGAAPAGDPTVDDRFAEERRRAATEISLRAERIRLLSDELRQAKRDLRAARADAEKARRELRRLRKRRVIRFVLGLARRARPLVETARAARSWARRATGRTARPTPGAEPRRIRASRDEEARFSARLAAALMPSPVVHGPTVSVIIVTRDGIDHLRRLLPAIGRLAYRDLEVVLVDNGSSDATITYVRRLQSPVPIRVIRNADNRTFSDANNQGVAEATGDFLLLLNNDIAPASDHVLGHMVRHLLDDPTIVAVASRLIYPRRQGPMTGPATAAPDLTLQHRGIGWVTVAGVPVARNLGTGDDPLGPVAATAREVQGATAAALLVRRSTYEAVGGLPTGYDYGWEDVDFSVRVRAAGGRIMYEPQATFWHHESATQAREDDAGRRVRQLANRERFADHWAPRVFREVFLDKVRGAGRWSEEPLHVGITLTRDDVDAGWGDWYTAHELGDALSAIGWRVTYLERHRDRWYDPPASLDVVISLLDALDVRRLPDGVVTVAWVRNWTDRWITHPWFDEYDLVLASSRVTKDLIDAKTVHVAELMPLATNPVRFRPPETRPDDRVDVVATGNHWGADRGALDILPRLAASGRSVALYGRGWADVPSVAALARGPRPYEDLPAVYASAAVVVDDTAEPTLPYGALNARVFDALAAGTLVVTDNEVASAELFEGRLPAAGDPAARAELVGRYLDDPAAREASVAELRSVVLGRHTYAHRAVALREHLAAWAERRHVDIAIGPPDWAAARNWGDYHFGRGLQRALQRAGMATRIRLRDAWEGPVAARADIAIHVFGLTARRTRPGQVSVLWIISHPDLVTDDLVERADIVFTASDAFATTLAQRLGRTVLPLHQATDPDRFAPGRTGPVHELLFVANSRGVRRPVVDELTPTDRDLGVYGRGWTPELLDPRHLRGEHIPNDELAGAYGSAAIVLNDHWPDMAEQGFLSNRLYDAAAAGAFVVSDHVEGIEEEFDGGIVAFHDGVELRSLVDRYLVDPDARAAHAARAKAAVLARHTFAHRAAEIAIVTDQLLLERPDRVIISSEAAGGMVPEDD